MIVSPRIPQNLVDHRTYDHASIPATVEKLFGIPPLTQRDRHARDVTSLLSLAEPGPLRRRCPRRRPGRRRAAGPASREGGRGRAGREREPAGILHIAERYEQALSPAAERPVIQERVAGITTRGEARQYLEEVAAKTAAARSTRGR